MQQAGPLQSHWWFSTSDPGPLQQANLLIISPLPFGRPIASTSPGDRMRRHIPAAPLVAFLLGTGAFAQQPPWSEQLPAPQPPNYGRGAQGPLSGPGPNNNPNANGPVDQGTAPDRGVARLGYMSGNVSVRRGDTADLV